MSRSSRRHRILDGFAGMLNNCKWLKQHAASIANLAMPEHPEYVDWCKAVHDLADMLSSLITDLKGKT